MAALKEFYAETRAKAVVRARGLARHPLLWAILTPPVNASWQPVTCGAAVQTTA
ncbi:hypothetical protein GORHZ_180_00410 [Gordonia rhizosphera NBRC 16068]|uniref:Uncharacterized protein n=1 Tax=Gordonia rhizosphera NBRC 16068 TaxID=1108045 RepID=K6VZZ0_9ACTN|nr:hypothetical protein GORHZ_180_00410 [Gordonia rhizosphera NBRC 16068]